MRRIQYNLAYLAAIADRSHKPSSQIPPHPAVISAPSLTPLPKPAGSSPTSPNGAVKLGTDGAADSEDEDRAETLKKQYKRLQELFPGVDPKKEPLVQPAQAAQKQQQQQQQQQPGGPSAPQKAQMAAQMHAQLAQMSQAQKMEFMQRKGMLEAGGQFANRPPGQQQPNAQQQQQLNRMRQQQQQMQQQQPGWRPGQPGGPQQGGQRMAGMQQGGMEMGGMGMGGSPAVQGMQQPGQGQGQ